MKILKNNITVCFVLCIFLTMASDIVAKDIDIKLSINGKKVEFTENSGIPYVSNDRTLVPIRISMENLGVNVEWIEEKNSVLLTKDNVKVEIILNEKYILVNDEKKEIDVIPEVRNERIYLPIRAVAEAFFANVKWNAETNTVEVEIKDNEKGEVKEDVNENNENSNILNATVNGDNVNVRISNNTTSNVIYKLNVNDRINVVKQVGNWYKLLDGENSYYIYSEYVTLDEGIVIEKEEILMPTASNIISEENKKWYNKTLGTDKWNDLIYEVSKEYNIDPVFVKVIMIVESGGENIVSSNGMYYGLMQISKNFGYDTERILSDSRYAIACGIEVILGKANAAITKGNKPTCHEVAWRYNSYSQKGLPYANKVSSLYEELSGNTRDTEIVNINK